VKNFSVKIKRFAGAILVNSENKILLQLRSKNDIYYPNCWTLPGGKVEENETVEQALEREIEEELGVKLTDHRLFRKLIDQEGDYVIERYIFWSKFDCKIENLKLGEGSALKYFSEDEISSLKIGFNLKKVIEDFIKDYEESKGRA
jgi:8-oxo-dGTP diphosphatase